MSITTITNTLQPATVVAGAAPTIRVRFDNGSEAQVTPAFCAPYQAQPGDRLLIIGEADSTTYAIGVLAQQSPVRWHFPADADLVTEGCLRLRGREVSIEAGRLRLNARQILARAVRWYRWVSDCVQDRLHRRHSHIDEDDCLQAGRLDWRARGAVDIDGERINLG